jgi:2-C-methyl-D-erythritol 4-phosphate cytidylyltransferase
MSFALILTAAGKSERMGGSCKKEYLPMPAESPPGSTVLSSSLYAFLETNLFGLIVITTPPGGMDEAWEVLSRDPRIPQRVQRDYFGKEASLPFITLTSGGASRQESVLRGLEHISLLTANTPMGNQLIPEHVLIHDGARPWIDGDTIHRVAELTLVRGAALPAIQPVDTQKEIDGEGKIIRHLDRARLAAAQTPQGFAFRKLLEAHRKASGDGRTYTDDTEIWGNYGGDVWVCQGNPQNKKVTWKGDL